MGNSGKAPLNKVDKIERVRLFRRLLACLLASDCVVS